MKWWVLGSVVAIAIVGAGAALFISRPPGQVQPVPEPPAPKRSDPFPELRTWPLEKLVPATTEMVLVPAGQFLYGESKEKRYLPAFYIDRYEVSQWQYAIFLEYIRRTGDHSRCHSDEPPDKDHTPKGWGWRTITAPDYPVVGLDYWDVYAYANWVGRRLPTEEEWEKAARGTDGRLYPWGNEWDPSRCNWGPAPGQQRTLVPVDSMPEGQSPYGCYHMLGNAAEWTSSVADKDQGIRVGRGYCWMLGHMTPYVVTYRMLGATNLRDLGSGLRCAMDAPADGELPPVIPASGPLRP